MTRRSIAINAACTLGTQLILDRQQADARHRKEDAWLAELENQQHRRMRNDRAEGHNADGPTEIGVEFLPDILQRHRQRLGLFGREFGAQFVK